MNSDDAGRFPRMLVGKSVDCVSAADAAAVQLANEILCGADVTPHLPDVERIAQLLLRYGRPAAAEVLREIAKGDICG
jgi:hypothetical protein